MSEPPAVSIKLQVEVESDPWVLKDDYGDTWKLIGAIELHRIRKATTNKWSKKMK